MSEEIKINAKGVIKIEGHKGKEHTKFLCKCPICGNSFYMWDSGFYLGRNSCSCQKRQNKSQYPRLYAIWKHMRTRCNNPLRKDAKYYKDIFICDEWSNYGTFRDWALANGYADNLTIDRIDNTKGYSPNNCRFVSMEVQNNNKRNSIYIERNGRQYHVKELCSLHNIKYHTFMAYKNTYGIERALEYYNI